LETLGRRHLGIRSVADPNTLPSTYYGRPGLPNFVAMSQDAAVLEKAQLMLTNPRDAFRGQSRSTNMVPFDMLGMV